MRFHVPITRPFFLNVAASHGFVDVHRPPQQLALYALAFVPLPGYVVTPAFFLLSVVHFAADTSFVMSVLFHAYLAYVMWRRGLRDAFDVVITYLGSFHVPLLIARCIIASRWHELVTLMYCVTVSVMLSSVVTRHGTFVLGHRMQMLVVIHSILQERF